MSPVKNIDSDFAVIIKKEQTTPDERNLRIYAKLDIPYAKWILIKEGYMEEDGSIKLA